MDYAIKLGTLAKQVCDCLVVGFYQKRVLTPEATQLDEAYQGLLSKLLKRDDLDGKAGETLLISYLPEGKIERILMVGLGKEGETDAKGFRKALNAAIPVLKGCGAKSALLTLHEVTLCEGYDIGWKIRQLGDIAAAHLYKYSHLKKNGDEKPIRFNKLNIWLANENDKSQAEQGLKQARALANGMNLIRDLANLPGNICTPAYLAEQAEGLAKRSKKLKVKTLNEDKLADLGMGAFLSVSRGSRQPPRLITLEYNGVGKGQKPIVLVGKGLTFDAGGISLKPAANMDEMKYDMCGGATVLGAMQFVAELGLPLNLVGLVPASENLPDGNANKPGDVVTTMAGLTVEILNTDAEGRLILCDTLTYAKQYDPAVVIDMATLTGACIVALGRHPSGLLGNDDVLCDALTQAGDKAGDRVWRLPIWEDYQEQLKSKFADLANIGGPDGGTITAACFLSRFARDYHWAHLDIAGTAWKTGKDKGATGRPLPLLAQYLLDRTT